MATNEQKNNNVLYSIPSYATQVAGPDAKPFNAVQGGTRGGPNNYGPSRGSVVVGAYREADLMNWSTPRGTKQQHYGGR